MQYKIAIHIPGFIINGLDSPERGESRWAQNLAHHLALKGHEVSIIADPFYNYGKLVRPEWGSCPKTPNADIYMWGDKELNQEFDVFMDTGWYREVDRRNLSIKAKLYVHGFWGIDEQIKDANGLVQTVKNHFYAFPIYGLVRVESEDPNITYNNSKRLFLPLPLYKEYKKENNPKNIMWPLKEVWKKDRGDSARRGRIILETIKDIQDSNTDSEVYFLNVKEFEDNNGGDESLRQLLKSIPRIKIAYDWVPYSICIDLLSRCRLTTTNGSPSGGPIYLEAAGNGGCPISWESNHWGKDMEDRKYALGGSHPEDKDIRDLIMKVWTDDKFYATMRDYMKPVCEYHTFDNSINQFEKEIERALSLC